MEVRLKINTFCQVNLWASVNEIFYYFLKFEKYVDNVA